MNILLVLSAVMVVIALIRVYMQREQVRKTTVRQMVMLLLFAILILIIIEGVVTLSTANQIAEMKSRLR